MKKTLFLILLLSLPSSVIFAQSKEDEAQALYQQAENYYENQQFSKCLNTLVKTQSILGKTNVKLGYLFAKTGDALVENGGMKDGGILNKKMFQKLYVYKRILSDLAIFFSEVKKDTYPSEKYLEMVNLKLKYEDKVAVSEKRKILYSSLKSREMRFIKDTIDAYASAFCTEFNEGFKNHPKINTHAINIYYGCPPRLEYDYIKHAIKVYDSKNLKYWHTVHMLVPININDRQATFWTSKEGKNSNYYIFNSTNTLVKDDESKKKAWLEFSDNNKINFKSVEDRTGTVLSDWNFDLSASITNLRKLKILMDSTGFSDFYDDGFEDIKEQQ